MPTYEYRCEGSEEIFEVKHAMALTVSRWAELAELGDFDAARFPPDAPVRKVIGSSGGLVSASALKNPDLPPCAGGSCPSGGCGM
ncbi:zinc ribbon domain-containing protein [Granulosicoccaceae sp. 1_MG-2023]|nr:zinc ribbon domain-containing protein [Granulosicoccaceae sp. 1_MG-2023]